MSYLMKLAEVLRDIAEQHSPGEIEQALDLCTGFADRVGGDFREAAETPESWWRSIATECSGVPN
jgi:hypothetical protein